MPDARPNSWCLSPLQIFWLLFTAGAVRAGLQLENGHFGPGYEMVSVARTLAATGHFANPLSILATGPTAMVPPAYPAFLALMIRLFGFTGTFLLVVWAITAAVQGLNAALLPAVSEAIFKDRRPGMWAAVLSLLFPIYDFLPQFETMYFAAGLMLFVLAAARWTRPLPIGLFAGALMLLNPASLLVTAPWTIYLVWRRGTTDRLKFAVGATVMAVTVLLPWTLRNFYEFHKLFLIRNNFGLELHLANNNVAEPAFRRNIDADRYLTLHPGGSMEEAQAMRDLGETEYNRRKLKAAFLWIRRHPGRFLRLTVTRVRMFWFPDAEGSPWRVAGIALSTLLSAVGLIQLIRRRAPIARFLGAVWLIYPPLYYLNQADLHYRAPILWVTFLTAGYFLVFEAVPFLSRMIRRSADAPSRTATIPF